MNISFNSVNRPTLFRRNPIVNLIFGIFAIAIVVVFIVLMCIGSPVEQIEDTNGAENFTLQTITNENIVNSDVDSTGTNTSKNKLTKTYTCSSNKFSGVEQLDTNIFSGTGDTITIEKLEVNGGNLKVAVVENNRIVHEFNLNESDQSYTVNGGAGTYNLMLAGESADFSLKYKIH